MAQKQRPDENPGGEGAQEHVRGTGDAQGESEVLALPLASAKTLSRPSTALPSPPTGEVGELTVSVIGDISRSPELDEVEKINRAGGAHGRTPLMTVVEAILASRGGSLKITELTDLVDQHWNRPFPASPYSKEEFVYVVVSNSDRVRVG